MAYIVPSDISQRMLAGAPEPELQTLARLRDQLGPELTVFHGVHWTRARRNTNVFGEADFVVVNNAGDVLVIEQKNGGLEETDAGLVKRYGERERRVVEQLHRTLDGIRDKYQKTHPDGPRLRLDYLLYCPDHRVRHVDAAGLDAGRIVDASRDDALAETIITVLGTGGAEETPEAATVRGFFHQTFDIVPDVGTYVATQEQRYLQLTGGLIETVDRLEMSPFRLRIDGVAGSGKTQLAVHWLQRASEQRRRPLYVCFNRALRDQMSQVVDPQARVDTFQGLCHHYLEHIGERVDFSRLRGYDPDFWRGIEERVVASDVPDDWQHDLIIVDEGQDFTPEWREILRLFGREDHDLLWLEDRAQNLFDTEPAAPEGMITYRADTNFRTPWSIARFIQSVCDIDFQPGNDLPGLGLGVHPYEEPDEQIGIVDRLIRDLVRRGFEHEQIMILTLGGRRSSALSGTERIANLPVRRFTGEYDAAGNQLYTDGRIGFESIRRFKGKQAPAVILTDVDPPGDDPARERATLLTALTRAAVRLEIVAASGNALTNTMLDAAAT